MKDIAVSKANFEEIIKGNYVYVDKTEYLYKIVSKDTYYFLSRPRRFGKTLFLSTLEAFFQGKRELFCDLYVYNQDWNWEEYPIVKLDFNEIENENREILSNRVAELLEDMAEEHGITLEWERTPAKFNELIKKLSKKYNKGVVFLADEYDKPIISHIGKGEKELHIARENMKFMKTFYDNLKALEKYLKTVFITGVSKFSKVSIFSTLNNLIELDMLADYTGILGYTEKEIREYFGEHFKKLAFQLDISIEELFTEFKNMYNGFRFTKKDIKLYNPFSVGKALAHRELDNYWFESGTPSFLVDLIKEKQFDTTKLKGVEIGRDELKAYDMTKLQLIPMLFQTGYLTIEDIEDEIIYTLSYPNYEVETGFTLNLIKAFSEEKIKTPIIHRIKKSLVNKEFDKFADYMKSLFARIANINIPRGVKEREHFYHTIFYLTAVLFSDNKLAVYSELLTSEGRIDMVVETKDDIFIIEFKCDQSAQKAIEQIEGRNYRDKYVVEEKEVIIMGINFDTERRNIAEIKVDV